jgi:hypothetical protein
MADLSTALGIVGVGGAATAGILLRHSKGKGSVMTRINGAQGWSDAARAFPW